ncbi:hypothetical protein J7I84_21290 [Arthrobacter sp. ISL-85]|uniref:hypothetical protein n=1 Tax=Arthrobacter sp. ISL-85 TaxID=2819115 RepID=UPI001BE52696|nr:hypothetical protein [Arthrobacter sp. ISL-85]MBT2568973.1 hypothetical protein [Arthrobacter sp. ISL-85]
MSDPAPRPGHNGEARRASAWTSPRTCRVLAVVFALAALGSIVLVAVDLVVGRPATGDLFIAFLNGLAAVVLWRLGSEARRT